MSLPTSSSDPSSDSESSSASDSESSSTSDTSFRTSPSSSSSSSPAPADPEHGACDHQPFELPEDADAEDVLQAFVPHLLPMFFQRLVRPVEFVKLVRNLRLEDWQRAWETLDGTWEVLQSPDDKSPDDSGRLNPLTYVVRDVRLWISVNVSLRHASGSMLPLIGSRVLVIHYFDAPARRILRYKIVVWFVQLPELMRQPHAVAAWIPVAVHFGTLTSAANARINMWVADVLLPGMASVDLPGSRSVATEHASCTDLGQAYSLYLGVHKPNTAWFPRPGDESQWSRALYHVLPGCDLRFIDYAHSPLPPSDPDLPACVLRILKSTGIAPPSPTSPPAPQGPATSTPNPATSSHPAAGSGSGTAATPTPNPSTSHPAAGSISPVSRSCIRRRGIVSRSCEGDTGRRRCGRTKCTITSSARRLPWFYGRHGPTHVVGCITGDVSAVLDRAGWKGGAEVVSSLFPRNKAWFPRAHASPHLWEKMRASMDGERGAGGGRAGAAGATGAARGGRGGAATGRGAGGGRAGAAGAKREEPSFAATVGGSRRPPHSIQPSAVRGIMGPTRTQRFVPNYSAAELRGELTLQPRPPPSTRRATALHSAAAALDAPPTSVEEARRLPGAYSAVASVTDVLVTLCTIANHVGPSSPIYICPALFLASIHFWQMWVAADADADAWSATVALGNWIDTEYVRFLVAAYPAAAYREEWLRAIPRRWRRKFRAVSYLNSYTCYGPSVHGALRHVGDVLRIARRSHVLAKKLHEEGAEAWWRYLYDVFRFIGPPTTLGTRGETDAIARIIAGASLAMAPPSVRTSGSTGNAAYRGIGGDSDTGGLFDFDLDAARKSAPARQQDDADVACGPTRGRSRTPSTGSEGSRVSPARMPLWWNTGKDAEGVDACDAGDCDYKLAPHGHRRCTRCGGDATASGALSRMTAAPSGGASPAAAAGATSGSAAGAAGAAAAAAATSGSAAGAACAPAADATAASGSDASPDASASAPPAAAAAASGSTAAASGGTRSASGPPPPMCSVENPCAFCVNPQTVPRDAFDWDALDRDGFVVSSNPVLPDWFVLRDPERACYGPRAPPVGSAKSTLAEDAPKQQQREWPCRPDAKCSYDTSLSTLLYRLGIPGPRPTRTCLESWIQNAFSDCVAFASVPGQSALTGAGRTGFSLVRRGAKWQHLHRDLCYNLHPVGPPSVRAILERSPQMLCFLWLVTCAEGSNVILVRESHMVAPRDVDSLNNFVMDHLVHVHVPRGHAYMFASNLMHCGPATFDTTMRVFTEFVVPQALARGNYFRHVPRSLVLRRAQRILDRGAECVAKSVRIPESYEANSFCDVCPDALSTYNSVLDDTDCALRRAADKLTAQKCDGVRVVLVSDTLDECSESGVTPGASAASAAAAAAATPEVAAAKAAGASAASAVEAAAATPAVAAAKAAGASAASAAPSWRTIPSRRASGSKPPTVAGAGSAPQALVGAGAALAPPPPAQTALGLTPAPAPAPAPAPSVRFDAPQCCGEVSSLRSTDPPYDCDTCIRTGVRAVHHCSRCNKQRCTLCVH